MVGEASAAARVLREVPATEATASPEQIAVVRAGPAIGMILPELPEGAMLYADASVLRGIMEDVLASQVLSTAFYAPESDVYGQRYEMPSSLNLSKAVRKLWDLPAATPLFDLNDPSLNTAGSQLQPGSVVRIRGRLVERSLGRKCLTLRATGGAVARAHFPDGVLSAFAPEEIASCPLYLVGRLVRAASHAVRAGALSLGG